MGTDHDVEHLAAKEHKERKRIDGRFDCFSARPFAFFALYRGNLSFPSYRLAGRGEWPRHGTFGRERAQRTQKDRWAVRLLLCATFCVLCALSWQSLISQLPFGRSWGMATTWNVWPRKSTKDAKGSMGGSIPYSARPFAFFVLYRGNLSIPSYRLAGRGEWPRRGSFGRERAQRAQKGRTVLGASRSQACWLGDRADQSMRQTPRAEGWRWGSRRRRHGKRDSDPSLLSRCPIARSANGGGRVNQGLSEIELEAVCHRDRSKRGGVSRPAIKNKRPDTWSASRPQTSPRPRRVRSEACIGQDVVFLLQNLATQSFLSLWERRRLRSKQTPERAGAARVLVASATINSATSTIDIPTGSQRLAGGQRSATSGTRPQVLSSTPDGGRSEPCIAQDVDSFAAEFGNPIVSLPLGETAFAQQANGREGRRRASLGAFRYDQLRHLYNRHPKGIPTTRRRSAQRHLRNAQQSNRHPEGISAISRRSAQRHLRDAQQSNRYPEGISASSRRSAQRYLRNAPPKSSPRPRTGSQRVAASSAQSHLGWLERSDRNGASRPVPARLSCADPPAPNVPPIDEHNDIACDRTTEGSVGA
ncbi:hypothetical protein Enr13x_35830 [Stieleria neptunia]|uniref:Transmembrane protein n=1 Tax=Stieleria neptunia TaxID=2527979 RepID=A0A518HSA0_9BACT|nr:hypothetical protein Enr13x_35830 [Stieleria neptunia]